MKKRLFIITIALICGLTMLLTVMEKPSQAFEVKTENGKKSCQTEGPDDLASHTCFC